MFDDINMKATIHQMCAKNSIKSMWYVVCGMQYAVCLNVFFMLYINYIMEYLMRGSNLLNNVMNNE